MAQRSTTFLLPQKKVTTRNAKRLDPYPTAPRRNWKKKVNWKRRLPLNNKLRTTQWIAKTQRVAAATQSKDLGQKT